VPINPTTLEIVTSPEISLILTTKGFDDWAKNLNVSLYIIAREVISRPIMFPKLSKVV